MINKMTFGQIRWGFLLISWATLLSFSRLASAQESGGASKSTTQAPAPQSPSSKGKRTTIDFEDELIEGQAQKPDLSYLLQKRQFNYKRMIKLRENFLPEMRKTSEDMQRKGSSD